MLLAAGLPTGGARQVGASAGQAGEGLPAKQWGADAAQNELKVIEYGRSYLRYQEHTRNAHGDQTRQVMETKDGPVARLVEKEGRPLTEEEDALERQRLQGLMDSPDAYAKHVKGEQSNKRLAVDLIKLMPEAMIYTYTPGQPQRPGHSDEVVLDYTPDPNWQPPTMPSAALSGLQGRVWIDAKTHFLTRMEGTVFKPVSLGWFLARIYPGGHLTFEQTRVSEQRWIFSKFTEQVDVRVLIKTMKENSDIEGSDFAAIPEMSYKDAIHQLMTMPAAKEASVVTPSR